MEKNVTIQPELKKICLQIIVIAAAIILPSFNWTFFGMLHPMLPLFVFFVLHEQGMTKGNRIVAAGAGVGLLGSFAMGSMSLFCFAASLLPVGYVLAYALNRQKSPIVAMSQGVIVLGLGWIVLLSGIVSSNPISPYQQLLLAVNTGIDEAIKYYRTSGDVGVDVDVMLESTLLEMKRVIPLVTPAILSCFALFTVWLSAAAGNWLICNKCGPEQAWPHFSNWKLPEKLIWCAIAMALLTFLSLPELRYLAINVLIALAVIYGLQGFGIAVFLMDKWKLPKIFRAFIYVMIIFQSFGAIVLLVLGTADTWIDFRKLSTKTGNQE